MLKIYNVRFFSHGEWRYLEYDIIAESEAQVRKFADEKCEPQWRAKPYGEVKEDSLVIKEVKDVNIPYLLYSNED